MSEWLAPDLRKAVDTLTDAQIVALVLYGEARSEPVQGVIAVGCVIRNRVKVDLNNDKRADWWGEGYKGVCIAPWQFSALNVAGGAGNYKKVLSFAERLAAKTPITHGLERQCIWVAHGIVGDYAVDITKASKWYHTATLTPRPKWAMGHVPVVQISAHVFYSDIK